MQPFQPTNPSHLRQRCLTLCASLLLAGASAAHAQIPKIGTVDIGRVFGAYYRAKEFEKAMRDSQAATKREVDERLETRRQLLEVMQSLNRIAEVATLSADAQSDLQKQREEKATELGQLEKSINEFKASRSEEIQESVKRDRAQIAEEIMAVIDAKVKSENYDLVLNKSGRGTNQALVVLYGNGKLDFTDDVIAVLNRNRPVPAGPPGK